MDAGHFDTKTAYAAANTLRLDDMNPHFWRTHDGGKTWTEIDEGIAGGAVANSIREDPRKKGLLYAATDTQVWVSFDDGDHWHSLRLDMPAISVRDIAVKDDASCLCSDLVAGTHGRGFWILDDVTPLRQAAEAAAASDAYLFKPATAVRVRFCTNDPTPWPPEVPAGENPPQGAVIDYYLPASAGDVKLEILDLQGRTLRTYSSTDPVRRPDPATDPAAYNKLCQHTPTAPDCGLPLYWPAPPEVVKTSAGMHRFIWDMHYDPLPGSGGGGRRGREWRGAASDVPGGKFAVGGAGIVHGALDRERQERNAADHGQDGSARQGDAAGAADFHPDYPDGGSGKERGGGAQGGARPDREGEGAHAVGGQRRIGHTTGRDRPGGSAGGDRRWTWRSGRRVRGLRGGGAARSGEPGKHRRAIGGERDAHASVGDAADGRRAAGV